MCRKSWLSMVLCVVLLLGLMLPVTVRAYGEPEPLADQHENIPQNSGRRFNANQGIPRPYPEEPVEEADRPENWLPDWDLPNGDVILTPGNWVPVEKPVRDPGPRPDPDPDLPDWPHPRGQQQEPQPRGQQQKPRNPELDSVPRTGDESGVTAFASLAAASLLCAVGVAAVMKKQRQQ